MIVRVWKGWTEKANAEGYENLLRDVILPGIGNIKGHMGAQVLRHDGENECEFMVVNLFESMEAVERFTGNDKEGAVIEPEARALLSRVEPRAKNYDLRFQLTK